MNTLDDIERQDEARRIKVYDFMGHSIFVGCNARANESLVQNHKRDHKACLWFHASEKSGPSVILCLGPKQLTPDMLVVRYAAARALRMSGLTKGQVLYAPLENVYKPEKSKDGLFRTFRTNVIEL